jgi:hypothetical protein
MKSILSISLMLFGQMVWAQHMVDKNNIEAYHFYYSDTANGEGVLGNYEPKDIVKLEDGSLLIGTELSISFPSQYQSQANYDSAYFARNNLFSQRSHISSGTVFKLNTHFEKEWEIIFKEQRIEKIIKTSDGRILIAGEHVSMKYVWLAEINANGKLLWERFYSYKNQVTIGDVLIDEKNDVYVLLEASHLVPVQMRKYYGKRKFNFFKDSEKHTHLAVLKVTLEGKKNGFKTIDTRKKYNKHGSRLIAVQQSVYASYTCQGFENDSLIDDKYVVQLSQSGKKVSLTSIPEQEIVASKTGIFTITSFSKGAIFLSQSGKITDSLFIKNEGQDIRIEKVITTSNGYLVLGSNNNRGYLLIKVNENLQFNGYWAYPRDEFNEIRGAVVLDNGEIIIVGKCYLETTGVSKTLTSYINLVKIKKGT